MNFKRISAVVFAGVLALASAGAEAADWRVERSTGDVTIYRDGARLVALTPVDAVKLGDRITTGKTGRVMLVRGAEAILISPGSELAVPASKADDGYTTLLQSAGEISFQVEKRNAKHFEVRTPFLAAIVKGTSFTVQVDKLGSRVAVQSGTVEVSDLDTDQVGLVKAGQLATAAAKRGAGIVFSGPGTSNSADRPGRAREASNGAGAAGSDQGDPPGGNADAADKDNLQADDATFRTAELSRGVLYPATAGFGTSPVSQDLQHRLLDALRTNEDWENIAYLVFLVVAIVFTYDVLSHAVRRRYRRRLRRQGRKTKG